MKKYLSFVMGLSALMAFSPQPAFSAPDTGPKVGNDIVFEETSAPAAYKCRLKVVLYKNGDIFAVPEQSDHPIFASSDVKKYLDLVIDVAAPVKGNFLNYNVSNALAVDDHQRRQPQSGNVMIDHTLDLDLSKNSAGLPFVGAAQHSHQLVWVMKRPGWTVRYLRC